MSRPNLFLVDVDGVVADLMAGFDVWLDEVHGERIPKELITHFNIPTSPALAELHAKVDLGTALARFLAVPDVYERYVPTVEGAIDSLREISSKVETVFVTATLKEAPESYVSKFNWCKERFGDIPMIAAPSRYKHAVTGRWIIDDRWDTCERCQNMGVKPLLFGAPWNEAPADVKRHDWSSATAFILDDMQRWP